MYSVLDSSNNEGLLSRDSQRAQAGQSAQSLWAMMPAVIPGQRAQLVSHVQCLSSAFLGPVCSPLAKSWLRYKGPMGCHSLICSTNIYQVFSIFWLLFR